MAIQRYAGAVVRAPFTGAGGRIGRSLRDGCIAMTVMVGAAWFQVDWMPSAGMAPMANLIGVDPSEPAAAAMLRVALFGGMVLNSVEAAKIVAVLSLFTRITASMVRAAMAARREANHA